MEQTPSRPPDETAVSIANRRNRKRMFALMAIAGIIATCHVYEIMIQKEWNGAWVIFPILRLVIPLGFICIIWNGKDWAKYLLVATCGWTLVSNIGVLLLLPELISRADFLNLILVFLLYVGYSVVIVLALTCFKKPKIPNRPE